MSQGDFKRAQLPGSKKSISSPSKINKLDYTEVELSDELDKISVEEMPVRRIGTDKK